MSPLGTMGLEAKLIAAALALAALLAGVLWVVHDLEAAGAAKAEAAQAKATAVAEAKAQAETVRRETLQGENFHATELTDARRVADADAADAALQRLRNQPHPGPARGATGTTAPGTRNAGSLPAAPDLSAKLRSQRDALAEQLLDVAKYADCLRVGGELCERDYGALTAPR